MNKKNIIFGGMVAMFIILGGFFISLSLQNSKADGGGKWWEFGKEQTEQTDNPILGGAGNTYEEIIRPNAGASFKGAMIEGAGQVFNSGTTTSCSLISPKATSTFMNGLVVMDKNATTTERTLYIATSTLANRYSTTTGASLPVERSSLILQETVLANTKNAWNIVATSSANATLVASSSWRIMAPETALVISFKGGTPIALPYATSSDLGGSCSATYQRFQ